MERWSTAREATRPRPKPRRQLRRTPPTRQCAGSRRFGEGELRGLVGALERARVRVRVGEQEPVRVQLRSVTQGVRSEIAEPPRRRAGGERVEPREYRRDGEGPAERAVDDRRGDRQEDPEAGLP